MSINLSEETLQIYLAALRLDAFRLEEVATAIDTGRQINIIQHIRSVANSIIETVNNLERGERFEIDLNNLPIIDERILFADPAPFEQDQELIEELNLAEIAIDNEILARDNPHIVQNEPFEFLEIPPNGHHNPNGENLNDTVSTLSVDSPPPVEREPNGFLF